MTTNPQMKVDAISLLEVFPELSRCAVFADIAVEQFHGIQEVDRVSVFDAGVEIIRPQVEHWCFWVVLDGEIRAERLESDGSRLLMGHAGTGDSFGEVPLLAGKMPNNVVLTSTGPATLLRFSEDAFWRMMASSKDIRKRVLASMAQRLHSYQAETAHREKLVSLGTLAAGLMHELHNPGAAAKRAATQLRENLMRLQELSLRFCDVETTPPQVDCMRELQLRAMGCIRSKALGSLEQADAEEVMAEWLERAGVANAYRIAPSLVNIGLAPEELDCARRAFDKPTLSDTLNWLESLVSSVSLVGAIEESVSRVSELVMAVKKFAYDDRKTLRDMDVHDSIQGTLTILGHKLHSRQIQVRKHFDAFPATITSAGAAMSQVWTNLIDNAIDASPDGGRIDVHTWNEAEWLAVSITDHGTGIPAELQARIFEPFFTTKPVGKGTGLGLEIVHRIVTNNFSGQLELESEPGRTRFVVRLPRTVPDAVTA